MAHGYQQGYDERCFEGGIREDLFCSICQGVLRNPRTCQNKEHPFCLSCISQHLRNSHTCPECREHLTPETLKDPPRFLKNILSELKIKCEYNERGCLGYVQLGNLHHHVERCGFAPVVCGNEGCGMEVNKRDKEIHERELCQFRIPKCHDCKDIKTNQDEMKEHVDEMNDEIKRYQDEMNVKANVEDMKQTLAEMKADQAMFKAELSQQFQKVIGMLNQLLHEDVIILGGRRGDEPDNILNTVEKFNIVEGKSTELPRMNLPRSASASCVYNGDVIVTGGFDGKAGTDLIEILKMNEHSLRWTMFDCKLPVKLSNHDITVHHDSLYITGGHDWNEKKTSNAIYELSLAPPYTTNLLARMPQPRRNHRVEIVNGKLFILGGLTTGFSEDVIDSVVVYDFIGNEIKLFPSLPKPICSMSTVKWGNMIILVGGTDETSQALSDVITYDTQTGRREKLPSLKHKRYGHSAVIMHDVIVVLGGGNEEEYLSSVESFTMGDDQWKELSGMKEKKDFTNALVKPRN